MRAGPVIACVLFSVVPRLATTQELASPQESGAKPPEDRLLEAEVLEVASGEVQRAMAVYRALADDEKTPEPARARALLCLARCQRKLGEVESARKTLEALVKSHAQERDVIRQARSFLRELESGRAANPAFDWLAELERSPEIQARVFDLAMDLAGPADNPPMQNAQRQLRALGAVAAPVLERVLEVTRDARHRRRLALLLVESGRPRHIGAALDPAAPLEADEAAMLERVLKGLPALGEEARRELLAALERSPADPRHKALVRAWARAWKDLGEEARSLEALRTHGLGRDALQSIVEADPQAAVPVLLERIADPACPFEVQRDHVELLWRHAPERLGAEPLAAHIERAAAEAGKDPSPPAPSRELAVLGWLERLEEKERFDVLLRLAAGPEKDLLETRFWRRYIQSGPKPRLREASERWAKVLRAARASKALHLLAEVNDAVVPELKGFLARRAEEDPAYAGSGPGFAAHWSGKEPDWKPSPAYLEAMVSLLDSKDPVTLAIALESLALAPERNLGGLLERFEALARDAADDHVREFALHALLQGFGADPEAAPRVVAALQREHERRSVLGQAPEGYLASPLAEVSLLGAVQRPPPVSGPGPRGVQVMRGRIPQLRKGPGLLFGETLIWILQRNSQEARAALYPHVLAASDSEAGVRFHEWFDRWAQAENHTQVFLEKLPSFRSRELRAKAVEKLGQGPGRNWLGREPTPEEAARIRELLKAVATDRDMPLERRSQACMVDLKSFFAWFDWPSFLRSDDALAAQIVSGLADTLWQSAGALPDPEKAAFFAAALASPQEGVRKTAIEFYPEDLPDAPEVLRKALKDPSLGVASAAAKRLVQGSRADLAPVLVEMLGHPDASIRGSAIGALPRFASPEAIEPLVKLLDDPDVNVRAKALESLKQVRAALEEKQAWRDLVRVLKLKAEVPVGGAAKKDPKKD